MLIQILFQTKQLCLNTNKYYNISEGECVSLPKKVSNKAISVYNKFRLKQIENEKYKSKYKSLSKYKEQKPIGMQRNVPITFENIQGSSIVSLLTRETMFGVYNPEQLFDHVDEFLTMKLFLYKLILAHTQNANTLFSIFYYVSDIKLKQIPLKKQESDQENKIFRVINAYTSINRDKLNQYSKYSYRNYASLKKPYLIEENNRITSNPKYYPELKQNNITKMHEHVNKLVFMQWFSDYTRNYSRIKAQNNIAFYSISPRILEQYNNFSDKYQPNEFSRKTELTYRFQNVSLNEFNYYYNEYEPYKYIINYFNKINKGIVVENTYDTSRKLDIGYFLYDEYEVLNDNWLWIDCNYNGNYKVFFKGGKNITLEERYGWTFTYYKTDSSTFYAPSWLNYILKRNDSSIFNFKTTELNAHMQYKPNYTMTDFTRVVTMHLESNKIHLNFKTEKANAKVKGTYEIHKHSMLSSVDVKGLNVLSNKVNHSYDTADNTLYIFKSIFKYNQGTPLLFGDSKEKRDFLFAFKSPINYWIFEEIQLPQLDSHVKYLGDLEFFRSISKEQPPEIPYNKIPVGKFKKKRLKKAYLNILEYYQPNCLTSRTCKLSDQYYLRQIVYKATDNKYKLNTNILIYINSLFRGCKGYRVDGTKTVRDYEHKNIEVCEQINIHKTCEHTLFLMNLYMQDVDPNDLSTFNNIEFYYASILLYDTCSSYVENYGALLVIISKSIDFLKMQHYKLNNIDVQYLLNTIMVANINRREPKYEYYEKLFVTDLIDILEFNGHKSIDVKLANHQRGLNNLTENKSNCMENHFVIRDKNCILSLGSVYEIKYSIFNARNYAIKYSYIYINLVNSRNKLLGKDLCPSMEKTIDYLDNLFKQESPYEHIVYSVEKEFINAHKYLYNRYHIELMYDMNDNFKRSQYSMGEYPRIKYLDHMNATSSISGLVMLQPWQMKSPKDFVGTIDYSDYNADLANRYGATYFNGLTGDKHTIDDLHDGTERRFSNVVDKLDELFTTPPNQATANMTFSVYLKNSDNKVNAFSNEPLFVYEWTRPNDLVPIDEFKLQPGQKEYENYFADEGNPDLYLKNRANLSEYISSYFCTLKTEDNYYSIDNVYFDWYGFEYSKDIDPVLEKLREHYNRDQFNKSGSVMQPGDKPYLDHMNDTNTFELPWSERYMVFTKQRCVSYQYGTLKLRNSSEYYSENFTDNSLNEIRFSSGNNYISDIARSILLYINEELAEVENAKEKDSVKWVDDKKCSRKVFESKFGKIVNLVDIDGDDDIDFVELTITMTASMLNVMHVFM